MLVKAAAGDAGQIRSAKVVVNGLNAVWCLQPLFTDKDQLQFQNGQVITSIIKWGMKLIVHSQTSTLQPLKLGNG